MHETVYVDLYFLFNFCLDTLVFFAVSRVLPARIRLWRLIFSALMGALFSLFILFVPLSPFFLSLSFLSTSFLACKVLFFDLSLPLLLRSFCFFLMTEFLVGGGLQALYAFLSPSGMDVPPFFVTLLFFALVLILGTLFHQSLRRRMDRALCRMDLTLYGVKLQCYALCDSGNLLIHPPSGEAVVLIGSDILEKNFPPRLLCSFLCGMEDQTPLSHIDIQTPAGTKRLYGVHIDNGVLYRFKKTTHLPPFFLAFNFSCKRFSDCDLLLPTTLL